MKKNWVIPTEHTAKTDLSLHWAHTDFVGFIMSLLKLFVNYIALTGVHLDYPTHTNLIKGIFTFEPQFKKKFR